jgi:hypothetical protein
VTHGLLLVLTLVTHNMQSTADVYENIRTAAIQTPSFLDKDVVDLMHKLLTPHSLKRATMMDVLKHPWLQKLPHRYLLTDRTVLLSALFVVADEVIHWWQGQE